MIFGGDLVYRRESAFRNPALLVLHVIFVKMLQTRDSLRTSVAVCKYRSRIAVRGHSACGGLRHCHSIYIQSPQCVVIGIMIGE